MSKVFGYARCSTAEQDTAVQEAALMKAGAIAVFAEKASGVRADNRPEWQRLNTILGAGDTLCVTRLDRLARSTADLLNIAADLQKRGVHLKVTEQAVDTSTPTGVFFFTMLAAFGQFEHAIRAERQKEGIEAAKAEGVYKGRKPKIDQTRIRTLADEGRNPTEIAKELNISRMSVYRALTPEQRSAAAHSIVDEARALNR